MPFLWCFMPLSSRARRIVWVVIGLVVIGGAAFIWWWQRTTLPRPGSPLYEEYAEAFQLGVAALDVGVTATAETNLSRAITLVPQEPAAWANRGLLYLRNNQPDKAAPDLARARELAPGNAEIEALFALLAKKRNQMNQALDLWRKAAE